jgi:hypothetical protein
MKAMNIQAEKTGVNEVDPGNKRSGATEFY